MDQIPVVKMYKSVTICFNLAELRQPMSQALTPGSAVFSWGCFAFLKQRRSMMRISAERAVEFLPCALGNTPPGRPPTLSGVDTLLASCNSPFSFDSLTFPQEFVCAHYDYKPIYSFSLQSSIQRVLFQHLHRQPFHCPLLRKWKLFS